MEHLTLVYEKLRRLSIIFTSGDTFTKSKRGDLLNAHVIGPICCSLRLRFVVDSSNNFVFKQAKQTWKGQALDIDIPVDKVLPSAPLTEILNLQPFVTFQSYEPKLKESL